MRLESKQTHTCQTNCCHQTRILHDFNKYNQLLRVNKKKDNDGMWHTFYSETTI